MGTLCPRRGNAPLKDWRGWRRGLAAPGSGFPDLQGTGHGHKSKPDPSRGVAAASFKQGRATPQQTLHPCPKPPRWSVSELEGASPSWVGVRKGWGQEQIP